MMRQDPVMKSEATPHYLELQFVHDRPSFLYSATSLMSSFLFRFWYMLWALFFLVETGDVCFLYMQAGEHRHEEVQRQKASLRGGENRQVLARLCTYYEMHSAAWSLTLNFLHGSENKAAFCDHRRKCLTGYRTLTL